MDINKISNLPTIEIEKKLMPKEKGILEKWCNELSITTNAQKVTQHRAFLLQFRDTINKPLDRATRDDLVLYWSLLKNSDYSWNSQCMKRKSIKRFIRFFFGEIKSLEMLRSLKAGEFKPSEKYNKETNIQPEELEKMLRSAQTIRDKAILILLYESAARPEELLKLKWKDLKTEGESGKVKLFSSKTGTARELPIKESVIHLKRWQQEWQFPERTEDDLIFPGMNRNNIMTTAGLNCIINKIAIRSGIKRNLTSYNFRHSRLTDIYNQGVQGFDHNLFAGHRKGSKQTATYVKTDEQEMIKAMLEKVYSIKEISPELKSKLEKDLEDMRKEMNEKLKRVSEAYEEILENQEERYLMKDYDSLQVGDKLYYTKDKKLFEKKDKKMVEIPKTKENAVLFKVLK